MTNEAKVKSISYPIEPSWADFGECGKCDDVIDHRESLDRLRFWAETAIRECYPQASVDVFVATKNDLRARVFDAASEDVSEEVGPQLDELVAGAADSKVECWQVYTKPCPKCG